MWLDINDMTKLISVASDPDCVTVGSVYTHGLLPQIKLLIPSGTDSWIPFKNQ
jgi:hypothetical protein